MVSPESSVDEDRYLETFDELSQSLTYTRSKSVDPSLNSVDSRVGFDLKKETSTYHSKHDYSEDFASCTPSSTPTLELSLSQEYLTDFCSIDTTKDSVNTADVSCSQQVSTHSQSVMPSDSSQSSSRQTDSPQHDDGTYSYDSQSFTSLTHSTASSDSQSVTTTSTTSSDSQSVVSTSRTHSDSQSITHFTDNETAYSYGTYSTDFDYSSKSESVKDANARNGETMERLMNNIRLNLHPSAPAETWVSKLEKAAEVWSESSKKGILALIANLQSNQMNNVEDLDTDSSVDRDIPAGHHCAYAVEKLRIDNVLLDMKVKVKALDKEIDEHRRASRVEHHDVSKYVLPRKLQLQREAFLLAIDKHEVEMNSVSMIGSLAHDLPKPTDRPEEIWTKLMNTAKRRITTPPPESSDNIL